MPERCRAQLQAMLTAHEPCRRASAAAPVTALSWPSSCTDSSPAPDMSMRRCEGRASAASRSTASDSIRRTAEARLYPTFFCRNCGQEHHPVVLVEDDGVPRAIPRSIDETPLEDPDTDEEAGLFDARAGRLTPNMGSLVPWRTIPRNGSRPHQGAAFACAATGASSHRVRSQSSRRRSRSGGRRAGSSRANFASARPADISRRPGARDQQAGGPVCRRSKLRDDTARFERPALDEWRKAAPFRPTSASFSASPTIARMPPSRPAISTISCSSPCCAPQRSPRFVRPGRMALATMNSGAGCSGAWASSRPTRTAGRNGCSIRRPRASGS